MIVAVAIVDNLTTPTQILCAQRSAPAELDGKWEFPGGKRETGETPEEAAEREIREEIGVSIRLGEPFFDDDGGDWPLPNGHLMRLWLAQICEGSPQPLEDHHELRWVKIPDLGSLDWLSGDVAIVKKLLARLS